MKKILVLLLAIMATVGLLGCSAQGQKLDSVAEIKGVSFQYPSTWSVKAYEDDEFRANYEKDGNITGVVSLTTFANEYPMNDEEFNEYIKSFVRAADINHGAIEDVPIGEKVGKTFEATMSTDGANSAKARAVFVQTDGAVVAFMAVYKDEESKATAEAMIKSLRVE